MRVRLRERDGTVVPALASHTCPVSPRWGQALIAVYAAPSLCPSVEVSDGATSIRQREAGGCGGRPMPVEEWYSVGYSIRFPVASGRGAIPTGTG
jgi:hypothetical protein